MTVPAAGARIVRTDRAATVGRLLTVRTFGTDTLAVLDPATGRYTDIDLPGHTTVGLGAVRDGQVLLTTGGAKVPAGLRLLDLATGTLTDVRLGVDGALELPADERFDESGGDAAGIDQDLAERPAAALGGLPAHEPLELVGGEVPLFDQQVAEARRPRRLRADERPLVEGESRALLAALELERAGPLSEVDELEDVGDGDVLETARNRHPVVMLTGGFRG